MIIGFDFDNTIACYDRAIARLAQEMFSLPADIAPTKLGLRDFLRKAGREPEWTEFQGHLYGPGMAYAEPFPGAINAIAALQDQGHSTLVISHRTKHPYLGPKHDLHAAARAWMLSNLAKGAQQLFDEDRIFLNESLDQKIARIGALKCDVFLDDLPDVLTHAQFPAHTKKLWFSDVAPPEGSGLIQVKHWDNVGQLMRAF